MLSITLFTYFCICALVLLLIIIHFIYNIRETNIALEEFENRVFASDNRCILVKIRTELATKFLTATKRQIERAERIQDEIERKLLLIYY